MRHTCALGLAIALGACAPAGPDIVVGSGAEIINGSMVGSGFRNVVAVARVGMDGGLCSGTLVGDYAVLTAKHCVFVEEGAGRWSPAPASQFVVVVGNDISRPDATSSVYEIRTTPGSDVDGDIESGDDVAMLLLPASLGLPSRPVRFSAPRSGEPVRLVGYGRTIPGTPRDDDSGIKYTGTANVNRVFSRIVESTGTSWTCQGDSGGPMIDDSNQVIGVTSFGIGGCTRSNSFYSRVDNHRMLINDAIRWAPPCEPEPERCGDGVDNDCNGMIDDGCTALGAPCRDSGECADGACEMVAGGRVCVRECDPRAAIPRCPFGFFCEAGGCGEGRCLAGVPGGLFEGDECASDGDCASNRCADVGGVRRCGRQCALDADPCDAGLVCETLGAACGSCIPAELSTGPRSFGAPCDTADQCVGGVCHEGFCSRACSDGEACPSGFHCRAGLCVRGDLGVAGDRCVTSEDCGGMAPECVAVDGDLLCAPECSAEGGCPSGLECGETSAGRRCVPPGLALGEPCADHAECRSAICAGVCTQLCDDVPCPEAFECRPAGEHDGCFPPGFGDPDPGPGSGGGCSATTAQRGGVAGGLSLLAFALALATRRRRG